MAFAHHTTTSTDRFTIALVLALVFHGVVILAVNFDILRDRVRPVPTSLDVVMVNWASDKAPEEADFLAQANQVGGGEAEERQRPSEPPAMPGPEETRQPRPEPEQTPSSPQAESPTPQVTTETAPEVVDDAEQADPEPEPERPRAEELVREALASARQSPDNLAFERAVPERPRRKFISANTREHLYAGYMRSWVAKVERVGNMNYPDEARRRNINGSLVMSVGVHADGSVERIRVLKSSGYPALDEAAVRIVRLSAPFSPLPDAIRAETDILSITRTWQFTRRGNLK